MLTLAPLLLLYTPDPLTCFTKEPGSAPGNNVCPRTYALQPGNNVTACAALCLADPKCQAFAMGGAGNPASTDCRVSHECPKPTSHLSAYDGFSRKPGSCTPAPAPPPRISFSRTEGLFADGMLLQRGEATVIWGVGATAGATVTVSVHGVTGVGTTTAEKSGEWRATLPPVGAMESTSLSVSDGTSSATLRDVAFGDLILCGGQSNMGFGMCGAQSKNQTPAEALTSLEPLRFFFQVPLEPTAAVVTVGTVSTIFNARCPRRFFGLPYGRRNECTVTAVTAVTYVHVVPVVFPLASHLVHAARDAPAACGSA